MSVSERPCKYCGEYKPGRMRYTQCLDCYNARRRERFAQDPAYRLRRQRERDQSATSESNRERQARYRAAHKHDLRIPVQVPLDPTKEIQPVILPDWFWHLMGPRVVKDHYNAAQVNPSSYDTLLADTIMLQRYRGVEYPNTKAALTRMPNYAGGGDHEAVIMTFRDPKTGRVKQAWLHQEPFMPGDSVLAKTVEKFYVPRFVRLQGMLKSSVAREGLDSRSALYVDPKFAGSITLELHFDRTGYLVPGMPLVQFEAQLCLSLKPYQGHYVGQEAVTPNRNTHGIGFRSVEL